jgi:hypothetical protein
VSKQAQHEASIQTMVEAFLPFQSPYSELPRKSSPPMMMSGVFFLSEIHDPSSQQQTWKQDWESGCSKGGCTSSPSSSAQRGPPPSPQEFANLISFQDQCLVTLQLCRRKKGLAAISRSRHSLVPLCACEVKPSRNKELQWLRRYCGKGFFSST